MKFWKVLAFLLLLGGASYGVWYGVTASQCPDSDADGLNDCNEVSLYHTDLYNPDTDGDGFLDGVEISNGFSPHYGDGLRLSEVDADGDGLMDDEEIERGTDLTRADTDRDGINDFIEVQNGGNPLSGTEELTGFEAMKQKFK